MYRVALVLGLLVSPAAAETYVDYECRFIGQMLDNCTVKPECDPIGRYGGGMSRASRQLAEAHPKWDWDKFGAVCKRVCNGQVAPHVALGEYCPRQRAKL